MRDVSYGHEAMKIEEHDHVHFFHSVNSMGLPQKYTTMVGGHFHEVTWTLDNKSGEPVAKCGPAMRKFVKNTARGSKTIVEPMKFYNKEHDQWVTDPHGHELEYKGSDELSTAQVQSIQRGNASVLQAMEPRKTAEADITESDRE